MKNTEVFHNTIPAVNKALQMLTRIANSDSGLTLPELVTESGATQTTGYRIVQTLLKHNYLEKHPGGVYELSAGVLPLILKMHRREPYWEHAQEVLSVLSMETNLSSKLSVRQGFEQLTIARADSPGPFSIFGRVGVRFPLIEGSVGACLLSRSDEAEIREFVLACKEDIAEKREPAQIFEAIAFLKRHGYLLNMEQNRWKIGAMSRPLLDAQGHVLAVLTLLGMPGEFTKERVALYLACLNKAAESFVKYAKRTSL